MIDDNYGVLPENINTITYLNLQGQLHKVNLPHYIQGEPYTVIETPTKLTFVYKTFEFTHYLETKSGRANKLIDHSKTKEPTWTDFLKTFKVKTTTIYPI